MADDFGLVPPVGTKELSGVGRLSGVLPVVGPFPCDLIFLYPATAEHRGCVSRARRILAIETT
jgi:hypothetical protein